VWSDCRWQVYLPARQHVFAVKETAEMASRLYVGNLPYTADEQQLRQVFAAFGDVVEVRIVTDRDSGQSKGFAFVEMTTNQAAADAITSLNGTQLGDRTLTVNEAKPRRERSSGYGSGNGYDRRPRRDDRSSY
jgi:RNA recognition motif-containing protein